jgi:outer membrane protein assembly factor BamB
MGSTMRRRTLLSTALVSGVAVTAAATVPADAATTGAAWPQFRFGPLHHGSNPAENVLSPANVARLRMRWATGSSTGISSSPAVSHGVAYVGSLDGKIYAIDVATGAVRWTRATGDMVRSSPDRQISALNPLSGGEE